MQCDSKGECRAVSVRNPVICFDLTRVRVRSRLNTIFSNKSDERVWHTSNGLHNVTIDQKHQRPDRVYGLSITKSFAPFKDRLRMYSPFVGGHTLFPFLIVEAKSAKSESGFHDLEQQTALSIRTCLRIQVDLDEESNQLLEPLVWFFGFRGDEWRLYMAVPVKDRTVRTLVWGIEYSAHLTNVCRKSSIVGMDTFKTQTRHYSCY